MRILSIGMSAAVLARDFQSIDAQQGNRQEHPPHEQSWEHHEGGHVEIRCAHRPRIADRMILVPYGNSVSTMIRNTALALCMGLL
eukprot:CAMPEP_0198108788 /NCGR_PEP_ID=MMETSP1442-20131203/828_1 /TAXON_ID= /ORGANISM="Craspedostauros australis, Strain CCMP3328" /LENGTH=84 /DNA_ID=CAMNT_0043764165 /DNA_START=53 /DNA_END=304 /DNA_ORIENTATION=+